MVRAALGLLSLVSSGLLLGQTSPFDLLITGARVIDGSGGSWYYADIGIRGDTIAGVGPLAGADAAVRIPDNRLVADTLEAGWNRKLRALAEAQEEYERQRKADEQRLSEEQRAQIVAVAADFSRLWKDPGTPDRERKRLLRLVVEDVTLLRAGQITAQVRFKGGAARTLQISSLDTRATDPQVAAEIDGLLNRHTRGEIAALLNERGLRPVDGKPFTVGRVGMIERYYSLKSRHQRLREAGLLTRSEMAQVLNISERTVVRSHADGRLRGQKCDDRSHVLYHAPANAPLRTPVDAARNNLRYAVQYEA